MKYLVNVLKLLLVTCVLLVIFSFKSFTTDQLPYPKIQAGIAKISGCVSNLKLPNGEKKVTVFIAGSNPVTREDFKYTTILDENNHFSLDVPLETNKAIVGLNIESETMRYGYSLIGLDQEKQLQLNVVFDDKGEMKIDAKGGLDLTGEEMINMGKALGKFEDCHTWDNYYTMTPGEFAQHELNISLKERIHCATDSMALSEKIKNYLVNSFNIRFLKGRLFFYKEDAEKSFKMAQQEYQFYGDYTAVEPGISYYSFLRGFNLNNPQHLYSLFYSDFLQKFLAIRAFRIPKINDLPIEEWLKGVKSSVKDVLGFDTGLFYDMLAANAYAIQMNDRSEPLTNKQVENITSYYRDKKEDFSKILLKKNEELVKHLEKINDLKINQTPPVAKENLVDSIVARYKGKVVLIDFWATWCGPCMNAHKDMKPLKDRIKDKGVVFVYLTNGSSPKPLWEGKIRGIGGEQYYLSAAEWDYIMDKFSFDWIPSYLIYDKNGTLKNKFTSFPGTEKMQQMVEELLL